MELDRIHGLSQARTTYAGMYVVAFDVAGFCIVHFHITIVAITNSVLVSLNSEWAPG